MTRNPLDELSAYRFRYSVVVASYNCAPYLEETILCMINQSLTFEHHIQLILVNDGSTDSTEEICLQYQTLYPQNIVYISKENGGVSSARNEGLLHAEGEYINFCDSDDYFDRTTMERIDAFRKEYGEESDVVCFNIVNFEGAGGSWINAPFFQQDQVLNMNESPLFMQHSVCSAFIKASVAKSQLFDTNLRILEDGHYLYRLFINNPYCSVVSDIQYWHRVRHSGFSATQSIDHNRNIQTLLPYFFIDLAKKACDQDGRIPLFLQNMFLQEFNYYVVHQAGKIQFSSAEYDSLYEQCSYILSLIEKSTLQDYPYLQFFDKYIFLKVLSTPRLLFSLERMPLKKVLLLTAPGMQMLLVGKISYLYSRFLQLLGHIGHFFHWLPKKLLWKYYAGIDWVSTHFPMLYRLLKKIKSGQAQSPDKRRINSDKSE